MTDRPCDRELTDAQLHPFKEWAAGVAPLYPPGSFVTAIISNDLRGAFQAADGVNVHLIGAYVAWMYWNAPSDSWGSRDRMYAWMDAVNKAKES